MASPSETRTEALHLVSFSPEDTQKIGEVLGQTSGPGYIYLMTGNLGTGKTCLTQGIARGLEIPGYVRSPTFVMITRYVGKLVLHHIDLYRVEDSVEALDLGLEEQLFGDGVCVVEWAERAADIFPVECTRISMEYGESEMERTIVIAAPADRIGQLRDALPSGVFIA